jgi:hypothetical protein
VSIILSYWEKFTHEVHLLCSKYLYFYLLYLYLSSLWLVVVDIGGGACRLVRLEPYLNWALLRSPLPEFRLWNLFAVKYDSVRSTELYFSANSRTFLRDDRCIVIKNKKCDGNESHLLHRHSSYWHHVYCLH